MLWYKDFCKNRWGVANPAKAGLAASQLGGKVSLK